MAKKSTTGGPRTRRPTEEDLKRRKEYKSHAERDRMWERRVLMITAVLVAISLFILVGAISWDKVVKPRQAITTVNGDKIKTSDFQARVRFERWSFASQIRELYNFGYGGDQLSSYALQLADTSAVSFGSNILDQMEEELLIKQGAKERGVTADKAAVERQVDEYMAQTVGLSLPPVGTAEPTIEPSITPTLLVSPTPSSTPLPTNTPTLAPSLTPVEGEPTATAGPTLTPTIEPTITLTPTPSPTLDSAQIAATIDKETSRYYSQAEKKADVDRDVVYNAFYAQALRNAVLEDLGAEVPTEQLQVNARHILIAFDPAALAAQQQGRPPATPTEEQKAAALEKANEVLAALQNGEPFADLAAAMSNDSGSAIAGGELGWASPDKYATNFADAVNTATIGEIVGPIETEYGYHIIQVNGREVRPLTTSELSSAKQKAFDDWLTALKADAKIKRREDWTDRVPAEPPYDDLLGDILPIG